MMNEAMQNKNVAVHRIYEVVYRITENVFTPYPTHV